MPSYYYPGGTFNSTYSGRLEVIYQTQFLTSTGFDWGSGSLNLVIAGTMTTGTNTQTTYLQVGKQDGILSMNYTGGTNVYVTTTYITVSYSGPSAIQAKPIKIQCKLYPNV